MARQARAPDTGEIKGPLFQLAENPVGGPRPHAPAKQLQTLDFGTWGALTMRTRAHSDVVCPRSTGAPVCKANVNCGISVMLHNPRQPTRTSLEPVRYSLESHPQNRPHAALTPQCAFYLTDEASAPIHSLIKPTPSPPPTTNPPSRSREKKAKPGRPTEPKKSPGSILRPLSSPMI